MGNDYLEAEKAIVAASLQKPRVQEALEQAASNSSGNVLADSEVQVQLRHALPEVYPELAGAVGSKDVSRWVNNLWIQREAARLVSTPDTASKTAWKAVKDVAVEIEQGSMGLRFFAALGICASCVNSTLLISEVLRPVGDPHAQQPVLVTLTTAVYLAVFGFLSLLFEVNPLWLAHVHVLDMLQNRLLENCRFLAEGSGRGLFYSFQGMLWLLCGSPAADYNWVLGMWFLTAAVFYAFPALLCSPLEPVVKMVACVALWGSDEEAGAPDNETRNLLSATEGSRVTSVDNDSVPSDPASLTAGMPPALVQQSPAPANGGRSRSPSPKQPKEKSPQQQGRASSRDRSPGQAREVSPQPPSPP